MLFSYSARAFMAPTGMRSPRGLLMGDAWTAVNNDEYTLLYNPASLSRHGHDLTITPLNPSLTGTYLVGEKDRQDQLQDLDSNPTAVADVLFDFPIHAGVGFFPGLKLFNFGFNVITSESVDMLLRNKIHPTLDVDYRSDRGFVTGFSIPLGTHRLKSKTVSGQQTSIGLGAKYIKRRGIYDSFSLTGTDILDVLDSDASTEEILDRLGMTEDAAWGFDAGVEHVSRQGPLQFVLGLAALDIGNTKFNGNKDSSGQKRQLAPNNDQVNIGAALLYRTSLFRSTFAVDVRGLTEEMETMERLRAGFELGIPGVSLLGGINSGYYSYGVALDFAMMRLNAGWYGVEAGGAYRRTESRRFVIYLSLFDFSFDV
jgi:hypothetical protein